MSTDAAADTRVAAAELERFEAGLMDAASFSHAEHVRLGFEMLGRFSFEEALVRYSTGLRRMAMRHGTPEKYHTTITVASLALIAERRTLRTVSDWSSFRHAHPEMFDRKFLERWYPPACLLGDQARRTFVLPPAT